MPLYHGIPYGAAPGWCFPLFELCVYALFILCSAHALQVNKSGLAYLLGGLAFGLLLEYMEVSESSYVYGRFWVMLGKYPADVPLCIGVGWGIIMYTARLFSDGLGLSLWACAALDTLLALNIDLSMDTVAYRMHMWHWDWSGTGLNPLKAQWFGIPWGNFVGWQTVVFCYSAFSRIFEKSFTRNRIKLVIILLLALICSLAVLYGTESYLFPFLHKIIGSSSVHYFTGILIILLVLTIAGWHKKPVTMTNFPLVAWLVPGWFHVYFFSCLFILGFYLENRWMTIAACINILIGVLIHVLPVARRKKTTVKAAAASVPQL